MFLSAISPVYCIFAACVYGIIAAIFLLALIFGRRARRNVKKETVSRLPDGFSPLDVQRIFIGKTYPRKITRALITHWAERGYIKVKFVDRTHVRIIKKKDMPVHDSADAVFFDRGTYVRERDLFNILIRKTMSGKTVNLNRPMFTKSDVASAKHYAVREDDGVYSAKHYTLKITAIAMCIVAALLAQISDLVMGGVGIGIIGVPLACIGLAVLMFVPDMPIVFKAIWCGLWLASSVLCMSTGFSFARDPYGITIASIIMLFVCPLFLVRFIDYREKINLSDYSDIVNYRKYLFRAKRGALDAEAYYRALPFLYAFNIKTIVKHKQSPMPPPDWYTDDPESKGVLP